MQTNIQRLFHATWGRMLWILVCVSVCYTMLRVNGDNLWIYFKSWECTQRIWINLVCWNVRNCVFCLRFISWNLCDSLYDKYWVVLPFDNRSFFSLTFTPCPTKYARTLLLVTSLILSTLLLKLVNYVLLVVVYWSHALV